MVKKFQDQPYVLEPVEEIAKFFVDNIDLRKWDDKNLLFESRACEA